MNKRFFLSEADGHLYRDGKLDVPFRKNIAQFHRKIQTTSELKATIRAADYAFGGTSLVLITDDGETLCATCARNEFRQIFEAVRDKENNGWRAVSACMDNEVEPCECVNCGAVIVEGEEDGFDDSFSDPDPSDDFVDSDPWRGGPEGDLYG